MIQHGAAVLLGSITLILSLVVQASVNGLVLKPDQIYSIAALRGETLCFGLTGLVHGSDYEVRISHPASVRDEIPQT